MFRAGILPDLAAASCMPPAARVWNWTKKRDNPNLCRRKCALGGNQRGIGYELAVVDSLRHYAWIRVHLRFQRSGEAVHLQYGSFLIILGASVAVHAG